MSRGKAPKKGTPAQEVLGWLERRGRKSVVAGMARYGITAPRAFGVTVGDLKAHAKTLGRDHALALALWESGWYEARILAVFVDDPTSVTSAQMDAWARDFDSWAIVDTACFHLFDRTRHAWAKVRKWAKARPEFTKRAAFALLWSLSVHDRDAPDGAFLAALPLLAQGAGDDRPFVKKAVDMALRAVGKRNPALNAAAVALAEELARREEPAPRWIGRHALRELQSPTVRRRLAR